MSTRSVIGILNSDLSVEIIYCHNDGYPSHNGKILLEHWPFTGKVRSLMGLGDISSLGYELGEKHDFDKDYEMARTNHWTRCYGRDRGEENVGSQTFVNIKDAIASYQESWCEYFYLWDSNANKWLLKRGNGRFTVLKPSNCKD